MSRIKCPKCGGRKNVHGYGYAAGPLATYTFCNNKKCYVALEVIPDLEGLTDEQAQREIDHANAVIAKTYGESVSVQRQDLNSNDKEAL
jgi:hypothetical protein